MPNIETSREFGKKGPQNFCSEGATIAFGQGASENENYGTNPTRPKTDFSSCFGINEGFDIRLSMLTLSNGLSFIRAPLALLFLQENISLRIGAVILAMITDSIDGYLARRSKSSSRFGAILDPTMDKFFVYFALTSLFLEQKVTVWGTLALLCRDFSLCFYGILMLATRRWKTIEFRAIRWGKITTALQFVVVLGIVVGVSFPWPVFALFPVMGWFAFLELYRRPMELTTGPQRKER